VFYSTLSKDTKGNWCHNCFSEEKRDTLELDGSRIRKMDTQKQRNDFEQEEGWVECDHCSRWVHQICGLFNKGRNNAEIGYMCPDCLCEGTPPPLPLPEHGCPSSLAFLGRGCS
jgi:E1A/CREB-binding protein